MSMKKNITLASMAIAATVATTPAFAYGVGQLFSPISMPFRYAMSGVSLSYGKLHQEYTEHAPSGSSAPNPLDSQHGNLRDIGLNFGFLGNYWGMGVHINNAKGTTQYKGYLQTYNSSTGTVSYTPTTASTSSDMTDISFRIRGGVSPIHQLAIVPDVFYGIHLWNRNTGGTGGYDEKYANTYGGFGLTIAGSPIKSVVLQIGYQAGRTMDAQMVSSISPNTAHLGSKPWTRRTAQIDWTPIKRVTIFASYSRTTFKYGQSQQITGYNGGTYLEPNSTTHQTIERVGAKVHFVF